MSNWQKIDTAPKDGTKVLLFYKEGIVVGEWVVSEYFKNGKRTYRSERWVIGFNSTLGDNAPSHWMPLPEAPTDR